MEQTFIDEGLFSGYNRFHIYFEPNFILNFNITG